MELHNLEKPSGSKKNRRRVGRGAGSGQGGQGGRGHKGQLSRSGYKRKHWNEGGQMPLARRIPKRGFVNPNKVYYQLVKVGDIAKKFTEPGEVNPEALKQAGLIKTTAEPIKIMGEGSLEIGLTIYAQAFTKSAAELISKAGGKAEKI
ncbi:MAG: 50S ribosomal protein L15 [candidate division Zixibacteria bacterium]|jgi:large subunit ribosomal protein L15|nr:50S ribosomal protein L15 [candidate division Zixibacteria bacterium]NIR67707.1 50S ribosomal protein L15 [candidate division Zixibacteria bacterium]NIS16773.1 50S ribosomal protein L15 [candidate division Zixibacteria bacterium]NIS48960.1 50S ribosomal protein L15 [candidate division Zixibacteria bacterium]NIT53176.1 50S ribosomal protein L15 [candidate division Zixibacteria bacterium]